MLVGASPVHQHCQAVRKPARGDRRRTPSTTRPAARRRAVEGSGMTERSPNPPRERLNRNAGSSKLPVSSSRETEDAMNPNQALWEKGDFTRIARSMRESGEAVAQGLGITRGLEVLDLGCGDGTTALPLAKLGARVLGVDIARNLVAAG